MLKVHSGNSLQEDSPVGLIQSWLASHFAPRHRMIFLGGFILTLLTHFYLFTNLFINHDNVSGMFSNCDFGLASGRWLLKWATNLAGNFSNPWLDGIVGAMFLAAACTVFTAIFRIRRPLSVGLLLLCMVAFPTVGAIYTYMFTSSQYFLSMLLAVSAAWLIHRDRVAAHLLGVVCIACSMGLYQVFFCLTAATLVLTMLIEVCEGRWKDSLKRFFATGFCYLGWLALGLILYLVITRVCLWYTGTELVDYQGISSMGQFTMLGILRGIKRAYLQLRSYYFRNSIYSEGFPALIAASLAVDAVVMWLLLFARQLHKNVINLLQLAILLVIFPLACNSVYLMSPGAVHQLMIYPIVLPLLLPVLLGDQVTAQDLNALGAWGKRRLRPLAILCVCGLLAFQAAFGHQFVVVTNEAYTYMDLTYKSANAYYTRLTAKIELQEGYTPDTHIAFLGKITQPSLLPPIDITGVVSLQGAINIYSRRQFLQYFMGCSYKYASKEEIAVVEALPEVQQMPCYPSEGSIATIDGIIVVKLGE